MEMGICLKMGKGNGEESIAWKWNGTGMQTVWIENFLNLACA